MIFFVHNKKAKELLIKIVERGYLTILLACLSLTLIFLFDKKVEEVEGANFNSSIQSSVDLVDKKIENMLREEIFVLEAVAASWRKDKKKEEWYKEMQQLVYHYNFQAIEWTEGSVVRWIVPTSGNEQAQDLDLAFEEKRRIALQESAYKNKVTIAGPIELVQGGVGLLIFCPLYDEQKKHTGFIVGVVKCAYVFDKALRDINVSLIVSSDDIEVYEQGKKEGEFRKSKVVVNDFIFHTKVYKSHIPVKRIFIYLIICVLFPFFILFDYVSKDICKSFSKKK
jgi:sensor domain CHASE-containing protein